MPNKKKQKKKESKGSRRSAYHPTPGEARRAKRKDAADIARETRQNGLTGKHPDLLKRTKTKSNNRRAAAPSRPLNLERYCRPTPQRRAKENSAAAAAPAAAPVAAAADVTAAKSMTVAEARKRKLWKQFIGMTPMP